VTPARRVQRDGLLVVAVAAVVFAVSIVVAGGCLVEWIAESWMGVQPSFWLLVGAGSGAGVACSVWGSLVPAGGQS
jgi:hypothetical protein